MKIFIAGATGFVGKHLIRNLSKTQHEIIAATRYEENIEYSNVEWKFTKDITDKSWLDSVLSGVDVLVHAAAIAHKPVGKSSSDQKEEFFRVNKELTTILYEAASKKNVNQLIYLSSIAAIRDLSNTTVTENTEHAPVGENGTSKSLGEKALLELSKNSLTRLTILRPCLVYGAENPGNMGRLLKLISTRAPLPFASIDSRRSFLYIENLIDAIKICFLNEDAYSEDFIVCDNEKVTLPRLIELISKSKGYQVKQFRCPKFFLVSIGLICDYIYQYTGVIKGVDSMLINKIIGGLPCSNEKIKSSLGWEPPFSISQGINKTFK